MKDLFANPRLGFLALAALFLLAALLLQPGKETAPWTALGPWATPSSPTQATVTWWGEEVGGTVEYGPADLFQETGALPGTAAGGATPPQHVTLTGLAPGTRYAYRVRVGNSLSPVGYFTTPPESFRPFTFLVYGDTRTNYDHHAVVARRMAGEGAEFVVTGEVLGQRPMSQHYRALKLVAEESGLGDRLVRPLSGRLLPATYPEKKGWVKREDWLDIQGRSRRRQLSLARKLGIRSFTQPAGGCCILLEKTYAARLRDAFDHLGPDRMKKEDFALLRLGRHFRISPKAKVIVGRHQTENAELSGFARGRIKLDFPDVPGPTALLEGEVSEEELLFAARIAARYADAPPAEEVRVVAFQDGVARELRVKPLSPDDPRLKKLRIG